MKNSVPCSSCGEHVFIGEPPRRGPSKLGNEVWICLWCDEMICVNCYVNHTVKKHPERYDEKLKKNLKSSKKKKK